MFDKVLVANRGEIACRVIRGLREMGIRSVAVCSEADGRAKHVRLADEVRVIGPAASRESYLVVEKIIEAARITGAQAVHPGYGFLSENELFREACDAEGIAFIGPTAAAMRLMGSKTAARQTMEAAGVPIVPGTTKAITSVDAALGTARGIGFPVLLKAAAGGGGKGMRLVHEPQHFASAYETCHREAVSAFGDGTVYIEKAIIRPRHIEIQVLCDRHGNALHLFERECSVQRRHQKVIEEAPAANLSLETVQKMGAVAVAAAKAIDYEGAGTVEFLVDSDENFYFLEMNTRLQVEHPVTELVTGVDLVHEQVRIAAGESISFRQEDIVRRGHAVECRLYAEDPYNAFLPSPGRLCRYRPPGGPGIRVDDGVDEGDEVTPFYDPMIAKVIAWAPERKQAIARMRAALAEMRVGGIRTNRDLLDAALKCPAFAEGRYATDVLEGIMPLERPEPDMSMLRLMAAVTTILHDREVRAARRYPRLAPSRWATTGRTEKLVEWDQ